MKQINNYILEKLKVNSKSKITNYNFKEDEIIQTLGEIICAKYAHKPLQDYINGKAVFDKEFFKYHQSNLWKIINDKHWFYGRNINKGISEMFKNIINDNISDKELYNIQQNLLIGFKNRMNIKESFEENTFWKIDRYFGNHKDEKKLFIDIVDHFRDNPGFTTKNVEEYIKDKEFKNLKKFIDFLDDIIKPNTTDRDYNHILYMIIKRIISDKNEGEKYTNKKIYNS